MKLHYKILLIAYFVVCNMFLPFVFVNCSAQDVNYTVSADESQPTEDEILEACQNQTFLTQDCVDAMQNQQESLETLEENIEEAYANLSDFDGCYTYDADAENSEEDEASQDDGEEAETTETSSQIDCETIVASIQAGIDACEEDAIENTDYTCEEIQNAYQDAQELCANQDSSVSEDFCALL